MSDEMPLTVSRENSFVQRGATPTRLRQLKYNFDLLYVLVQRNMKLRYKRSIIGMGWSLINPLAQLVILNFVFSRVAPVGSPHYIVFLFTGLLAWNWFSESLNATTDVIVKNAPLVKLPNFPLALLPVAAVATSFIHFLIALPLLIGFMLLDDLKLTVGLLSAPLVMTVQFVFTLSLGYFLAALQVNFRDTHYLLTIALGLGFFATGIFFDPATFDSQYQIVFKLNPMTVIITAYRTIFVDGSLPDLLPLALLAVVSTAALLFGLMFFRRASASFAEEI